ncbi:hypothetical protein [Oligoflexus tunisiensis]|uniref:hypothetical protein n=1 Tax=Oligoflexus tunisiensis TaxID=708132 RepID=UPI00114CD778|nr:hypothetical protein [Oligoflexus tunisiensis]
MTAIFTICSALATAAVVLYGFWRYLPSRNDVWLGFFGYSLVFLLTAALGLSGVLSDFSRVPPPLMFFVAGLLIGAVLIVLSPWGGRVITAVPLRALVGLQGFRILPEILLDLAWREGLAPIQMTWHGRNYDIIAAVTALLLAAVWNRLARPRVWAWVQWVLAFGLLLNIVIIAILSAPVPFRVFMNEPANTFVARFPYIWLPGVHVLTAFVGHGLTLRYLLRKGE